MQSKNFKKSLAASKAKRSILLSRSEFEEQKDPENLRLSTLFYNKEEFFKLIIEFLKSESRSVSQNNLITEYLLSLTNLASVFPKIQTDELCQHIFLYNITKSLKFELFEKHEMLMKYGEAGFNFYFLLKGSADIIVSKWQTVYLTEEKYLEYLMKLKICGENDFLQKTLSKNAKKYLLLNQKALNDFVFEEVKKIKTQKDYENLSEEYQRFFRDFVLKANTDFRDFSCFKFNNTFNGFDFNFNKKNNFNFDKENDYDKNENEPEINHEKNYDISHKSFNIDFNLRMKHNSENPEKNNFNNQYNSSNFLNKHLTKKDEKEIKLTKASNISLNVSPKSSSKLDSIHIISSGKDNHNSKSNLKNLLNMDNERKKSIIHFKGILEKHSKAVTSAEKRKRKESYFYKAKAKKITTEAYINRIKPVEANQSNNNNYYFNRKNSENNFSIIKNNHVCILGNNNNNNNNNNCDFKSDEVKKEFKILLYYHVKTIKSGDVFGQMALLKNEGKRTATLIATEDCYLGVLDKKAYNTTLQEHDSKKLNQDISLFIKGPIFCNYPKLHFFKNLFNLFEFRKIDKGTLVAKEGDFSDYFLFVKEGVYEVRLKCSLAEVNRIVKMLGGQPKKVHNEDDYMLDYDDFREYMNKKLDMKILLINQENVIGFRDFVFENKFLFTVECISISGSGFYIKREVFDEVAYHSEYFINKNIKEYEKLKTANIIERLGILKNSYIDMFFRKKKLSNKQSFEETFSFLDDTKQINLPAENTTNNATKNTFFSNKYFSNSNKNYRDLGITNKSETEKKYTFHSDNKIADYSLNSKAFSHFYANNNSASTSMTFRNEKRNYFSSCKINCMQEKFELSPLIKRNLNFIFSKKKIILHNENSSNKLSNINNENNTNNNDNNNTDCTLCKKNLLSKEEDCVYSNMKTNRQYKQISFLESIENHKQNNYLEVIKNEKQTIFNNNNYNMINNENAEIIRNNLKYNKIQKINLNILNPKCEAKAKEEAFLKKTNNLKSTTENPALPSISAKQNTETPKTKKDSPKANSKTTESELQKLQRLLNTNSSRVLGSKVKFAFNEINKDEELFDFAEKSKQQKQQKNLNNATPNFNKISAFSESLFIEKKDFYVASKFKSNNLNKLNTTKQEDFGDKKTFDAAASRRIFSKSLLQNNTQRNANNNVKLKEEIQMLGLDVKIINLSKLKKRKLNSQAANDCVPLDDDINKNN